jgi:hypothetical protein
MVRHLGHYDLADQKKIIKMASANWYSNEY